MVKTSDFEKSEIACLTPSRATDGDLPEAGIELTKAMLEAGAEVIWRSFSDEMPWGSSTAYGIVSEIYQAISLARCRAP